MKRGIQEFSGQRQRYDFLAVAEISAACERFLASRNLPVNLPRLGMSQPATEAATAAESPIQQSAMENRRIIHESRPPRGEKKWERKVNTGPAPSLKPDWKQIVADGQARGLLTYPKSKP